MLVRARRRRAPSSRSPSPHPSSSRTRLHRWRTAIASRTQPSVLSSTRRASSTRREARRPSDRKARSRPTAPRREALFAAFARRAQAIPFAPRTAAARRRGAQRVATRAIATVCGARSVDRDFDSRRRPLATGSRRCNRDTATRRSRW